MATKPYFLWGDTRASSESDLGVFVSGAPETAAAATTAAGGTAVASPDLGAAAAVARPRLRRSSSVSGKQQQQQQQQAGAKKVPQRRLGVAELERLRCGGDPLRDLSAAVVVDAAGAQGHPVLHYHQHHLQIPLPPSAFDAAAAGAQLLAPAPPTPPGPVCFLHPPAAVGCQRAPLVMAPEQQYLRDRWGRMGGFSPAGVGADDHQRQLLPAPPLAPEHPSSQSTIWRPAASPSSCLHTGHRCDRCCRKTMALAERGAEAPTPPASPIAGANTNNTMPDYSIYDLAAAMATGRQGGPILALETRRRGAAAAEAPAKKEVREIQFFPAASANHTSVGSVRVPDSDESELAAPFSSPYAGRTAPQLDLSLRL